MLYNLKYMKWDWFMLYNLKYMKLVYVLQFEVCEKLPGHAVAHCNNLILWTDVKLHKLHVKSVEKVRK